MIRLLLARHGNTFEAGEVAKQVGARTDLPLTAEGRKQAAELAAYLKAQGLSSKAIYAGALKRQIESAQILTESFSCPLYLHEPALTEIDYGLWEGLSAEEIIARWPEEYALWTTRGTWASQIFGGTLQHHLNQIEAWLSHLRQCYHPGDTVLAFSSNGLIRFFHPQWQSLGGQLKVKTGHFCELVLHSDSVSVTGWNISPQSASRAFR